MAARRGQPDARTKLILGPWVHGGPMGTVEEQSRSGERVFGPAAAIDYDETILRFMDRYVRGLDNGVDREPAVRAFVMGENAWREADRWPLPGTVRRTLVLDGVSMPGRPGRARLGRDAASERLRTRSCPTPRVRSNDPYATERRRP